MNKTIAISDIFYDCPMCEYRISYMMKHLAKQNYNCPGCNDASIDDFHTVILEPLPKVKEN